MHGSSVELLLFCTAPHRVEGVGDDGQEGPKRADEVDLSISVDSDGDTNAHRHESKKCFLRLCLALSDVFQNNQDWSDENF